MGSEIDPIDSSGGGGLAYHTDDNNTPTRTTTTNPETGVTTVTETNPDTHTTTIAQTFRDKHVETYTEVGGSSPSVSRTNSADGSKITLTPEPDGRMREERSDAHSHTVRYIKPNGEKSLDGESGDANSGLGPLDHIHPGQPQSAEQMLKDLEHPEKDPSQLDPNSGGSVVKFTEADRKHLGRAVPVLEVLDPNNGLGPISQLDPNKFVEGGDHDDKLDPNDGREVGIGGVHQKSTPAV